MIKNQTKLIDKENATEWRVERRTAREDVAPVAGEKPKQKWAVILQNKQGHRRFVAEERIMELYEVVGAEPAT